MKKIIICLVYCSLYSFATNPFVDISPNSSIEVFQKTPNKTTKNLNKRKYDNTEPTYHKNSNGKRRKMQEKNYYETSDSAQQEYDIKTNGYHDCHLTRDDLISGLYISSEIFQNGKFYPEGTFGDYKISEEDKKQMQDENLHSITKLLYAINPKEDITQDMRDAIITTYLRCLTLIKYPKHIQDIVNNNI